MILKHEHYVIIITAHRKSNTKTRHTSDIHNHRYNPSTSLDAAALRIDTRQMNVSIYPLCTHQYKHASSQYACIHVAGFGGVRRVDDYCNGVIVFISSRKTVEFTFAAKRAESQKDKHTSRIDEWNWYTDTILPCSALQRHHQSNASVVRELSGLRRTFSGCKRSKKRTMCV